MRKPYSELINKIEEFKVITEKLEDKSYDITYSNINEFRNSFND